MQTGPIFSSSIPLSISTHKLFLSSDKTQLSLFLSLLLSLEVGVPTGPTQTTYLTHEAHRQPNMLTLSHSYLYQRAVAISWRLFIKIIMVEDGDESSDHGLQDSAMFLNLFHAGDKTRGNGAVRHVRRCTHIRNDVFAYCVQGGKDHFVIHI